MQAFSPLEQVVHDLEQHENSTRIKKLIYCACKKTWENDLDTLAQFKFLDLIKELLDLSPTIEHLTVALNSVVKQLNKQAEYSLVANIIISNLGTLYPDSDESTQVKSNRIYDTISSPNTTLQQSFNIPNELKWSESEPKSQYDAFELRLEIMKYTNPLMAKILIFSTLHHKFDFSSQDWITIRTQELDDLLLRLFRACETFTELEFQLNSTAKCLEEIAQFPQAAGVIIRSMKPFYPSLQQS
jgi:hypothetical protein